MISEKALKKLIAYLEAIQYKRSGRDRYGRIKYITDTRKNLCWEDLKM